MVSEELAGPRLGTPKHLRTIIRKCHKRKYLTGREDCETIRSRLRHYAHTGSRERHQNGPMERSAQRKRTEELSGAQSAQAFHRRAEGPYLRRSAEAKPILDRETCGSMKLHFYLLPALLFSLTAGAVLAQDQPVSRLACVSIQVADLAKTRQFYGDFLGFKEAFDLRDARGEVRSAFFKVNDDQYLEFSVGAPAGYRLEHISLLSPDLKKSAALLLARGITPGPMRKSADGSSYFTLKNPSQTEIWIVQYMPGSKEAELRGKALSARRVSDHLQHYGVAADSEAASMTFYQDKLGLREFLRGGHGAPGVGEIYWIDMAIPGSPGDFKEFPGDFMELMTQTTQPVLERQHMGFEVPSIQRAYKELLSRGLSAKTTPFAAKMGRWLLFMRDPNGMRVELMGESDVPQKQN
jgi:catechol 2,3-dioxygenase-like lactoylglutathione lyase family enzyme